MKLIKQSYEILTDLSLYAGKSSSELIDIANKEIEVAGRTCYKSEENIKEGSAESFTNRMIKSGHGSILEHGSIYLFIPHNKMNALRYMNNKYSVSNTSSSNVEWCVTTNMRLLVENNWLDDLQYICSPNYNHELRISVRFKTDRAITHELVRHRVFSFAQESQRYCNYSKDKFDNEVSFVLPSWVDERLLIWDNDFDDLDAFELQFISSMINSEDSYFILLDKGWKPEQARAVLPNSTATEIVMTGFISDWHDFFKLRTANSAHPQMRDLIIPLEEEFKKLGL